MVESVGAMIGKMADRKNPLAGMKRDWYAFFGNSQQILGVLDADHEKLTCYI